MAYNHDIEFDMDSLQDTAEALKIMNPKYLESWGLDTTERIVSEMMHVARSNLGPKKMGYVSTGGFVLTAYTNPYDKFAVKASVSAFCAKEFAQKLKKVLDAAKEVN